ncbi:MAG: class I SAM-dependent methyltransferase [Ignavibacteriaceae bacterium]
MEQLEKKVALDETRLHELMLKVVTEIGAAANGALLLLGDKLNLFKTLAKEGPMTSGQLADATGTNERLVREWLSTQAASGFVEYDNELNNFYMTPEQAAVMGDDESPFTMTGTFYSISSIYHDEPKVREAFKTGKGVGWGDHDGCLFCGVAKFFKPLYKNNLINNWIPALKGVQDKLTEGIKVADVGCGHGISTILMAEAFPNSEFTGYDFHEPSIIHARDLAKEMGLKNVSFEVASAKDYPGSKYQFITIFDALHDMGDPVGAAAYARKVLDKDGTLMVVEPFANDSLQENLNPVGRIYYAYSTMICTPNSLSQEVALGLGAQAGKAKITEVLKQGGFNSVGIAVETPFNLIFEARG